MTCGACDPQAFHEALGIERGARCWGYTCRASPFSAVRELYLHGAELVLWDTPGEDERLKLLLENPVLLRTNDILLLSAEDDICADSSAALEGMGIRVNVLLKADYDCEAQAASG